MRAVLKRPILSEKTAALENLNQYVFEVDPQANKIEIRRAVEGRYNVQVTKVRTMNIRPERKERWTGRGFYTGKTRRRKKAVITVADGQTIDVIGDLTGIEE